jgi:hypothetical protein
MKFFSFGLLAGLALTVPAVFAEEGGTAVAGSNVGQGGAGAGGQETQVNQTENAAAQELANAGQASNSSAVAGDLQNELGNISLDPNNLQGSVLNNIEQLMLGMGVCNFDINSLSGLGLSQEIQLLLQLQQLQQLQALGIVNAATLQGFLQQELFVNNFSLGIIKRKVNHLVRVSWGTPRPPFFPGWLAKRASILTNAFCAEERWQETKLYLYQAPVCRLGCSWRPCQRGGAARGHRHCCCQPGACS